MNRPTRTQRERRRETRAKLIAATIKVINDKGYAATRANDITKRSSVTWGAVQHLFGGKDELLTQVAASASESLIDMLQQDIDPEHPPIDRLTRIIDRTWEIYSSSAYVAMVEIVRGTRTNPKIHDRTAETQENIINRIEERWVSLFSDTGLAESRLRGICTLVVLFLSGLAARKIYLLPDKETANHIAMIKKVAIRELSSELATELSARREARNAPVQHPDQHRSSQADKA